MNVSMLTVSTVNDGLNITAPILPNLANQPGTPSGAKCKMLPLFLVSVSRPSVHAEETIGYTALRSHAGRNVVKSSNAIIVLRHCIECSIT